MTDGQTLRNGQVIGYVGMSGRSTGPHLHYEVRIHDTPVNPHKYLRSTEVRPARFGGGQLVYLVLFRIGGAAGAFASGGFGVSGPNSTGASLTIFLKNAKGTLAVSTASFLS